MTYNVCDRTFIFVLFEPSPYIVNIGVLEYNRVHLGTVSQIDTIVFQNPHFTIYTHANKKKAIHFTCFVENKYRHEHVMTTKLNKYSYIVINCIIATIINAFYESFAHA